MADGETTLLVALISVRRENGETSVLMVGKNQQKFT